MAISLADMNSVVIANCRRAFTDMVVNRLRPSPFFRYYGIPSGLSDTEAEKLKAKIDAMSPEEFERFAERVGRAMADEE